MEIVKDDYLSREKKKPGFNSTDGHVKENLYVIDCCARWDLNQKLAEKEIINLVTVLCAETRELTANGRLLKDVAAEADRQMRGVWKSGVDRQWIEKLLADLLVNPTAMATDVILLREKVYGEPGNGSYYIQDGNHRMTAAGIYWIRHGCMPDLTFHIGRVVDQQKFFKKR